MLVYLDEIKTNPNATLVFVSKEQDNIIVDLKREIFSNEKISDLSKITWPRHADGMCEYGSMNDIAIEAGTKGWLFGGYVSEMEDMAEAK